MFLKGSRYEKVKDYPFRRIDGSVIVIRKKRKIPAPEGVLIHTVSEGDRTDLLANQYYHDPLKFWKLVDGNNEMNPEHLLKTPGGKIVIPPDTPD